MLILVVFRRAFNFMMRHPVLRNSVQISAIYAAGDLTQQKFVSKVKKYDINNTRNAVVTGG